MHLSQHERLCAVWSLKEKRKEDNGMVNHSFDTTDACHSKRLNDDWPYALDQYALIYILPIREYRKLLKGST